MTKLKMFVVVAMFGLVLAGGAAPAYAAATTTVATTTAARSTTSTTPLYFFNAIGIQTTYDAAREVWKDAAIRKFVMELWRFKTFGYYN